MRIIIEGFILSAFLFLYCYFGKRKSPVNLVYLYEKEVQDKVVELGLITAEKIKKNAMFFKVGILGVFFPYLLICVYGINGTRGFWEGFLQMIGILAIEGLFDRIVVDIFWVGCTKAWIIPGTEAFMPYIPVKVHIRKWFVTLVMYPAVAALLAGIFAQIVQSFRHMPPSAVINVPLWRQRHSAPIVRYIATSRI